nr:MAG TPA: hypothetical protein [Caudoviricetes sp.]
MASNSFGFKCWGINGASKHQGFRWVAICV